MLSARRLCAAQVALALLVAVGGAATPAVAADPSPAPAPAPAPADESAVTLQDLQQQSEQMAAQVREQQAQVEAERARVASAEAAAAAALAEYQLAQREADLAAAESQAQARRLAAATRRTEAARVRLEDYVGTLYRQGMGNERMSVYNSLLGSRGPRAFLDGLSLAERVGSTRGGEMSELADLQAEQQLAGERAAAAEVASREAAERATAAKELAATVVEQATRDMLASTEQLLRTQGAAAAAADREAERRALMAKAEQIAAQRAAIPYAAVEGALLPRPAADCAGSDISAYPNGRLPAAALCPLWGTSGQMLRADAAAAFDAMSRAFAEHFGEPICVGDSYRSFDEQVAVRAAKPDLAAVPGTSNHGWAVAVDLCGGVQSFGTPPHDWLRRNSLRYGWFLPLWAHPDGSKPEPWHWEFAG